MHSLLHYEIDDYSNDHGKQLHIAPMLHVSNTEFRNFFRLLTKKAVLWTEMVVDETIEFNAHDPNLLAPHLHMETTEKPIVCQIGGIDSKYTKTATKLIEEYGYNELNLNMDCPSNRVKGRNFGAVLMKDLDSAVEILKAMNENTRNIPVSVKCRIGIDEYDDTEFLEASISKLSEYCQRFTLHARKCLLQGLSPKENRLVPPLNYPRVYSICQKFPHCQFWINGGIPGLKMAKQLVVDGLPQHHSTMQHQVPCSVCNLSNGGCTAPPVKVPPNLNGCLLGRAAMDHPAQFWDVDRYFYGCPQNPCQNRRQVLEQYIQYLTEAYPRRCCDSDDTTVTSRLPAPKVEYERAYCSVCEEFWRQSNGNKEQTVKNTPSSFDNIKPKKKVKINSAVIDRCFKPILGLFFGLPGSKCFRRALDANSRDLKLRNCGPAFLLWKTLQAVPDGLLDQEFVKTENVNDEDIPVHTSPAVDCCKWGKATSSKPTSEKRQKTEHKPSGNT